MRRIGAIVLAFALAVTILGCGTVAEKSATEPSEVPDAVAEETGTGSATETSAGGAAEIKVEGAGFSVGEYGDAGYGIVLHNISTAEDAYELTITVNLLDKSGAVIATDNGTLSLLPANETFFYGGEIMDAKKAVKLEAFADIGSSAPAQYVLPQATNVRAMKSSYSSGARVKGQIKNTHEGTLSSFARICCVLFAENGKVVGGGFGFLDADLPSGRTSAFEIITGTMDTNYGKVAKARVSVENQFNIE